MERQLDIHQTITLAPPPPSEPQNAAPGEVPASKVAPSTTPPEHAESSAKVQAALAASIRTDASLSGLMRAIQELARGVGGAREANEQLVRELETLRELLGASNEQLLALKNRIRELEAECERQRAELGNDKAYLTEQYDAFLADLLDDHEQATDELRRERDALQKRVADLEESLLARSSELPQSSPKASIRPAAADAAQKAKDEEIERLRQIVERLSQERERTREALQRLQAQRDEAQSQAGKAARERDEARAELERLRGEQGRIARLPSTRPPARPAGASVSLQPARIVPKQPVLELDLDSPTSPGLGGPTTLPSPPASSKPPLRMKPDPSLRPLIGYSLRDSVAPESLGARNPSKPPKS